MNHLHHINFAKSYLMLGNIEMFVKVTGLNTQAFYLSIPNQ